MHTATINADIQRQVVAWSFIGGAFQTANPLCEVCPHCVVDITPPAFGGQPTGGSECALGRNGESPERCPAYAARLQAYESALATFDWHFEQSDDSRSWRAGVAALNSLHQLQAEIDPNGAFWLQHVGARGLSNVAMPRVGAFA